MGIQSPSSVVVIQPRHFRPNPDTAKDNHFQQESTGVSPSEVAERAYLESVEIAKVLSEHGVRVHAFEDERDDRPDSVFPNNWFSTHAGGHLAIYPMYAPSRRIERHSDVIEMLKECYGVQEVFDFSGLEHDDIFLEGTGAMVLDHVARLAYTCRSNRALSPLTAAQRASIEQFAQVVPIDIPTIELAGGSVRCMLAGVHFEARPRIASGLLSREKEMV